MKRTPPWVFVAAVGVQLAALGLAVWAMDQVRRAQESAAERVTPPPPPEAPPAVEALAPAPEVVSAAPPRAAETAPAREAEPVAATRSEAPSRMGTVTIRSVTADELAEQQRYPGPPPAPPPPPAPQPYVFHPEPAPRDFEPDPAPAPPRSQPAVVRVQPTTSGAPAFGPPPVRPPHGSPEANGMPAFIGELADPTTQIVCGRVETGRFAFGFYSDGNIRFVDVDDGRYTGKAESARARMREIDGARAFTVQIGVAADGRLQASFSGGAHDGQAIALEPLLGGSAG